jgi:sentrin-specific protease 1
MKKVPIIISKFGMELKDNDIETLNVGRCLNDSIINFYMQILKEKAKMSLFIFSSYFYTVLTLKGYEGVKKYKPEWLDSDQLLFPIHVDGCHWALVWVNLTDMKMRYWDSLQNDGTQIMNNIENFIQQSWLEETEEINTFNKKNVKFGIQPNNVDCGVIMLWIAKCLTLQIPRDFDLAAFADENKLMHFRREIRSEILDHLKPQKNWYSRTLPQKPKPVIENRAFIDLTKEKEETKIEMIDLT